MSWITFLEVALHNPHLDYRVTWIVMCAITWVLSLWMIYALQDAILANLPGIKQFSRKALNRIFLVAVLVAIATARIEYSVSGLAGFTDPIDRALGVTLIIERVICMVALLVLLSTLAFILWFPVQMQRNLAVFSFGFVFYFAVKTGLILLEIFWAHGISQAVSTAIMLILSGCFAYWAMFINAEGEAVPVRLGHIWRAHEQQRLVGELEALNKTLLASARRYHVEKPTR